MSSRGEIDSEHFGDGALSHVRPRQVLAENWGRRFGNAYNWERRLQILENSE